MGRVTNEMSLQFQCTVYKLIFIRSFDHVNCVLFHTNSRLVQPNGTTIFEKVGIFEDSTMGHVTNEMSLQFQCTVFKLIFIRSFDHVIWVLFQPNGLTIFEKVGIFEDSTM